MSSIVGNTTVAASRALDALAVPSVPAPAPADAGFAGCLDQALSSFSRRQQQTEFLRLAGDVGAFPAGTRVVDEAQRELVWRNAIAGLGTSVDVSRQAVPDNPAAVAATSVHGTAAVELDPASLAPLAISDFPRPSDDNGRGVHWIPTLHSDRQTVDRYVERAADMDMKWVVLLNDGTNTGDNDYLVKRLTEKGIMPVMRVFTNGLEPVSGDIEGFVRHYRALGVSYFQLYNEPNLMVETGGEKPDVGRYLDVWVPAAKRVIAAGGLPGIGALSPQGEADDREFLAGILDELRARGEGALLNRSWLAVHNYTGPRPMSDPDGFLRFRQYDAIIRQHLGRSLPMVGAEGGTHVSPGVSEPEQVRMVLDAYDYMAASAEPYNFSYTYWIIANEDGGGKDPSFNQHALFRPDGPTALANALMGSKA